MAAYERMRGTGAASCMRRSRGYADGARKARLSSEGKGPALAERGSPLYALGNFMGPSSRIIYAPILHGSLPFALAVREVFLRERPDCVAVELPETMEAPVERAVRRLPLLSVLRYETAGVASF